MTFAELAGARGISKASAIKLVRRHGWRRQRDNEGHVRALVPGTWATGEQDSTADCPGYRPAASTGDASRALGLAEAALTTLREQLETAQRLAVTERARADASDADRRSAEAVRDAAIARADALRDRIEGMEIEADARGAAIERAATDLRAERERTERLQGEAEARERTDAARRQAGRLARLRAAWRGE
jgi:hypothetical protein